MAAALTAYCSNPPQKSGPPWYMRSNEDLQQFAHVASHDLKEPLRKIKFFINRLQNDAETHLSDNGNVFLDKVIASAQRMSSMIEGVLSYSSTTSTEVPTSLVNLNGEDYFK
ncbi:hypothetical protein MKQ68_11895 [Chitinophaga horti]|uniref:histidine kinase n=1 Tax=Chitinophaga horti TaxID=2920382 RepID=A0ABY6JBX3_9BACT|nr:histidine kinase dimerization/phospho-acceptor domain-containing protein [Chitinophaga horti]UYQ95804.1 hypothetical protein MKQ68_11895 [Chitinophaga horti]